MFVADCIFLARQTNPIHLSGQWSSPEGRNYVDDDDDSDGDDGDDSAMMMIMIMRMRRIRAVMMIIISQLLPTSGSNKYIK